jgi:hypothetical protein
MKAYSHASPDRTGSQINEDIFAYAHCSKKGWEYIGSCGTVHFPNHYKLSKMLGLPLPFTQLPSDHTSYIEIKSGDYSREVYSDPNILIDHSFIGLLRDKFLSLVPVPARPDNPKVAVHIRRGDVKMGNLARYVPNAYYVGMIQKIKEITPHAEIAIYSEANSSENFNVFRELGCKLFLDADLEFTWKEMIFADVLVMSKGSFAYVPALYNQNFVIYHPAWYTKLDHWHSNDDPQLWKHLKSVLNRWLP